MPKAKERKQDDKIKNQGKRSGGKPVQQEARRVMTAKLKKELAQQKRAASGSDTGTLHDDTSSSTTAEAVEQVEQTAGAAVREVGRHTKQGVSRAVTTAKNQRRKIKERQEPPAEPPRPPEAPETPEVPVPRTERAEVPPHTAPASAPKPSPAVVSNPASPKTRPVETAHNTIIPKERPVDSPRASAPSRTGAAKAPIGPKAPKTRPESASSIPTASKGRPANIPAAPTAPKVRPADTPADPAVPKTRTAAPAHPLTPEDRMRKLAVDKQKELAHQPKPVLPKDGEQPTHYGRAAPAPGTPVTSEKTPSFENQSIHQSIKERPRQTAILKEKRQGWTITPRTRQDVEQAARSTAIPTKAPGPAKKENVLRRITDRARRKAQTEAQRGMMQNSKRTAKAAADLSKKAATATAKAGKELISALSALVGGGTLAAALCVIFLIAAVIASPFGLLFSNEPSPGAVPLNAAVTQINVELTDKLALLQAGDYDSIDIQGSSPDWREVAAVFAVKTATGADGVDVAALTPDRVDRLKAVFWDMCVITTSVETVDHPASGTAEAWTETILHITITAKTADDMRTEYRFTQEQNSVLTELLAELNGIGTLLGDLGVSQEDAAELLRHLPEDLSPERRAVIETACKLVGKVNYFWGGKSLVLGWDSRWGTIQKVWAAGSPSTGTYRPYGMDCSGFVDWVFYNMSGGSYVIGHGGGARMQHSYCTPISWSEAQPGDLVFYPDDTHVGIVGGWDGSGNIQIIHCASGQNNVVVTGKAGFTSIGRPNYYG